MESFSKHSTTLCRDHDHVPQKQTAKHRGRTRLSQRVPSPRRLAESVMISRWTSDDSLVSRLLVSTLDSFEFISSRSSSDICGGSGTASSNWFCDDIDGFRFCQLGNDLSTLPHNERPIILLLLLLLLLVIIISKFVKRQKVVTSEAL